jgi:hypothetical protein
MDEEQIEGFGDNSWYKIGRTQSSQPLSLTHLQRIDNGNPLLA